MLSPRNVRLHWDAVIGWIVDVPVTLSPQQLARIAQWALPKQRDRYCSLPPGVRRDELARAITLLERGEIRQRLIDHDGDGIIAPFASTVKATPTTYVDLGRN